MNVPGVVNNGEARSMGWGGGELMKRHGAEARVCSGMTYEEWEAGVPAVLKADAIWRVQALRLGSYLSVVAGRRVGGRSVAMTVGAPIAASSLDSAIPRAAHPLASLPQAPSHLTTPALSHLTTPALSHLTTRRVVTTRFTGTPLAILSTSSAPRRP